MTKSEKYVASHTTNPSNDRRRKLVKSIASVGGVTTAGLAGSTWIKPAVSSILLPAHGNTTGLSVEDRLITGPAFSSVNIGASDSLSFMDSFIQSAYAGTICQSSGANCPDCVLDGDLCFDRAEPGKVVVYFRMQSSASIDYEDGVEITIPPFSVFPPDGTPPTGEIGDPDEKYDVVFSNVVIQGNSVSGTLSCSAVKYKSDNSIYFNEVFIEGSCGA